MLRGNNPKKSAVLLICLALILAVTAGGTLALLQDREDPLQNLFTPSKVTTKVDETLDGSVKRTVRIQNTGTTDAWIRAAVVITWQDERGNVFGQAPQAGVDYTAWTPGTGWRLGNDDFFYYTRPVASGDFTGALIESISPVGNPPADGYFLNVEVIGSGIQHKPAQVFEEKWTSSGLTVSDADPNPMNWKLE